MCAQLGRLAEQTTVLLGLLLSQEFWLTDKERVYLVGVSEKKRTNGGGYTIDESLEELGRLAETAGLRVSCG